MGRAERFDTDPVASGLPPADRRRGWLAEGHVRTLAILALGVAGIWALRLRDRPAAVPDPPASFPARFNELADRLDPDTATAAELAVLPGIGPSKAQGIVAHREAGGGAGGRVFESAEDLADVGGIGPATVEKLRPYLYFPSANEEAAAP